MNRFPMTISRRGFIALASGLLVPVEPEVRRAYSFIRHPSPERLTVFLNGAPAIELPEGFRLYSITAGWPGLMAHCYDPARVGFQVLCCGMDSGDAVVSLVRESDPGWFRPTVRRTLASQFVGERSGLVWEDPAHCHLT